MTTTKFKLYFKFLYKLQGAGGAVGDNAALNDCKSDFIDGYVDASIDIPGLDQFFARRNDRWFDRDTRFYHGHQDGFHIPDSV